MSPNASAHLVPFARRSSLSRAPYLDGETDEQVPAQRISAVPVSQVSIPHRLPLPTRRILDLAEAAEYVGVSATLFLEEVERGMWPRPMRRGASGRRTTWDVRALDAAADLASGLVQAAASPAAASAEAEALKRFR
ncbi:MAG: hypothetical protein ACRYG8_10220 [Janthinobacterium lividum]